MVKKLKLSSIFKNQKTKSSWTWPPFKYLGTFLFQTNQNASKNINFALHDAANFVTMQNSSCSQSKCFSSAPDEYEGDLPEIATKALKSKRLFFEPGNTSSILEAAKFPFPDCVALAIESQDPYVDFRFSMEEMVETCGLKDCKHLEQLLAWYLRMNIRKNHCFIVEAFVDMFTGVPRFSGSISHYASASSSKSEVGGD